MLIITILIPIILKISRIHTKLGIFIDYPMDHRYEITITDVKFTFHMYVILILIHLSLVQSLIIAGTHGELDLVLEQLRVPISAL